AAAQQAGWAEQAPRLHRAARQAYEQNEMIAAAAWWRAYRWARLWGQVEGEFIYSWIEAVQAAGVAHTNMALRYDAPARPLAARVSPELQEWLLRHGRFGDEFFSLLQPVDFVPRVFAILNELHAREPRAFEAYATLALAIAVVFDAPPPPYWPHAQVSGAALTRRWPQPAEAFDWWKRQDQEGRTFHRLSQLRAEQLKFVVDAAAPFPELEWAQKVSNYPLGQLERAYTMVRYRTDRAANRTLNWPGQRYTLPEILAWGGICVDQAYFATQTGKARGVPTLFFYGAGKDGRHAWFGFLGDGGQWQLDAGRYAEQRFVTGLARDPQTWLEFSDHQLRYLTDRFRDRPSFKQSQTHAVFAADYLGEGRADAAARAARLATKLEPRNEPAWELLLAAEAALGRPPKVREGILREAMVALERYPDLEAIYSRRIAESLRARGERSAAEMETRRLLRKTEGNRGDLALRQAQERLIASLANQPWSESIRVYNGIVDNLGRGAGIAFFDQIVTPFVEHLLTTGHAEEAASALERARRALVVEPESQLDQEFTALKQRIR
ncbi:MAG TPA: hypothetical protein VEQ65_09695, partial [Opitutus sp.]|nr:hypothetical protein [Opitutus sp.]